MKLSYKQQDDPFPKGNGLPPTGFYSFKPSRRCSISSVEIVSTVYAYDAGSRASLSLVTGYHLNQTVNRQRGRLSSRDRVSAKPISGAWFPVSQPRTPPLRLQFPSDRLAFAGWMNAFLATWITSVTRDQRSNCLDQLAGNINRLMLTIRLINVNDLDSD